MASILVAEDDKAVREFVGRALRQDGHRVMTVADGFQALDAMAEGAFELLIADIVMPELDGVALALKAAKDYPGMRILLMTGYAAERHRAHNLDALIDGVITKPFTLQQIRQTTAETLSRGRR